MNAAGDDQAGVASGVNNAASRVAGLLAIAALGTVAVTLFAGALDARLAAVDAPPPVKEAVWQARHDLAGLTVPSDAAPSTRSTLIAAVHASFLTAFRWIMGLAAALGVLSAGCAALTIPAGITEDEDSEPAGAARPSSGS
jgi:hypothetical protein